MEKKKRLLAALLSCGLAMSLLPMAALADTGDYVRQRLSETWDSYMLLYTGEDGESGFFLIPSEYDAENYRLVKAVRGDDSVAQFEYDSQGSPTKIVFDSPLSTRVETWQYDSQGREIRNSDVLTHHGDEGDQIFWDTVTETVYDSKGRVEKENITMDGESVVRRFVYDSQDRVIEEHIESESAPGVDVYTYEGDYLVKDEYEGDGVRYVTLYTYTDGRLTEQSSTRSDYVGDGAYAETESTTVYFAYDSEGRMTNRKSDTYRADRSRTYSDEYQWKFFMDGKLRSQDYVWEIPDGQGGFDLDSRDCVIDYDNAGRVLKVMANNVTHTYTYDEAGNNTMVAVKGEGVPAYEITFTYEPIRAEPQTRTAFTDVAEDAYYAAAVAWAVAGNVTTGTSDTTFSPDRPCTRAQVVTFLWRAMGEQSAQQAGTFTDVPAGSYYEKAVAWAVERGVTQGISATAFGPDRPCTRAQVVTFLHRAMGEPQAMHGTDLFTDVPAEAYYFQPVLWAVDNGVTQGTSASTFGPGQPCTRAQVVTFLYRALEG